MIICKCCRKLFFSAKGHPNQKYCSKECRDEANKELNKEYNKQYKKFHKEEEREYNKQYYETNKEKILQYNKNDIIKLIKKKETNTKINIENFIKILKTDYMPHLEQQFGVHLKKEILPKMEIHGKRLLDIQRKTL